MRGIILLQRLYRKWKTKEFELMMSEFILEEIQDCKETDARHTIRRFLKRCFNTSNIVKYKTSVLQKRSTPKTDEFIFEQREVHHVTSLIQSLSIV